MKLEEILKRLKKTIDLSKTLNETEYYFYLFETLKENPTATFDLYYLVNNYVNWNIEGFENINFIKYKVSFGKIEGLGVKHLLSTYHGLSPQLINILFCGTKCEDIFRDDCMKDVNFQSLQEVIEKFDIVYKLLENRTITPDWKPNSEILYGRILM